MKILHVVNIPFVIPYFLGEQLRYFGEKGHEEYVACSPSRELAAFTDDYGFAYLPVEILRKISPWKDLKAVGAVARYIRKHHIDIVTGHTPKGALVAMLAAYICRTPQRIYLRHGLVYETAQGMKRRLLMTIDRLTARLATQVICVSPSVARRSLEDGLNKAEKQTILGHGTCNGIDTARFSNSTVDAATRNRLRAALQLQADDMVVGYVGRLVRDKGIVELVQAFLMLHKTFPRLKLLLVGMLEERDALPETVISTIRAHRDIITTGYVLNSDIERYYALMDVFVLPSYREGFPTSILEASAMEKPVVTTRATGCIDAIIDGQTGLFATHTPEDLAEKIAYFCDNVDARHRYGVAGRQLVVEKFAQRRIWGEIEKLYSRQG